MKNMKFVSLVVLSLLVVSSAAAQFLLRGTIGARLAFLRLRSLTCFVALRRRPSSPTTTHR